MKIDLDFLVMTQRHATNLLKWDILSHFARHPAQKASAQMVAEQIGRQVDAVRPELGEFALTGILQQQDSQPVSYQLTADPHLRAQVAKFAERRD